MDSTLGYEPRDLGSIPSASLNTYYNSDGSCSLTVRILSLQDEETSSILVRIN